MVDKKAQMGIIGAIIIVAVTLLLVWGVARFIISAVNQGKDLAGVFEGNESEFGEPMNGSSLEEKKEKIKDPNIAPPELIG
jgi:flagellin-like protein